MRRDLLGIPLCAGLIAACPINGHAQATSPGGEVFAGGSKVWAHRSAGDYHTHGWGGSITGNFNRFVGVEMDLSQYTDTPNDPPRYSTHYTFLFGPHFAYRSNPRVNPFVHVLVGGTRGSQIAPYFHLTGRTAFTAAFGGGLDVKATRFLWFRVIQADYLRESFPNDVQNNLRLSFGVVFRFGSSAKPGKH